MTITAKANFKERVHGWADRLGARVTSISVRPMTTKWASYSTTGRLTFDALLLDLREELQDYVIAHELLHVHVPNHGRLWKSLMRAHLGEHEELENELRRMVHNKGMPHKEGHVEGPFTFTAAFAVYGAQLKNKQWAFSAIANDGALVLSCWHHLTRSYVDGHKRYEDDLSRWKGAEHGKKLLREHLRLAFEDRLPVRLVVAKLEDPSEATDGDASPLKKAFFIDRSVVGRVIEFDGDKFAIEFRPVVQH